MVPAITSSGLARSWTESMPAARLATPITRRRPAASGRAVRRLGPGRPGRQGDGDRDAGDGPGRPPGRRGRGDHREHHARSDQPPRQLEPVDPVAGERLQPPARRRSRPPGRRRCRRRRRRPRPWPRWPAAPAAGAAGRADRGQHAELAQAALGDDHEAGRGDQGDQQQDDRGQGEHAGGGGRPLALGRGRSRAPPRGRRGATRAGPRPRRERRRPLGGWPAPAPSPPSGGSASAGDDQGELVVQVARVLDQADDGPGTARRGRRCRRRPVWKVAATASVTATSPAADGPAARPERAASACRRRPGGPGCAAPGARPSPGPARLGGRSRRRCRTRP